MISPFNHQQPVVGTPSHRMSTGAISTLVHAAVALIVVIFGARTSSAPLARDNSSLTFVNFTPPEPLPPAPKVELPPLPKEVLASEPVPLPPIEEPIPEPEIVRAEVEPEPMPEVPAPVIPEPPRRQPPVVQVGAFASTAVSAPAGPPKALADAGFDREDSRTSERSRAGAVVGGFDAAATTTARFGTGRAAGVADAGFGSGTATPAGRNGAGGRAIASSGFESGAAAGPARGTQRVQASSFDARQEASTARPVAQAVKETPLEILSKPTPMYTGEARASKIEGDVTLEVEFASTGTIQVLRVVRGLGYGLDEMAARAVQGMRFKPAQRNGEPVTIRTTVTIVFRLA